MILQRCWYFSWTFSRKIFDLILNFFLFGIPSMHNPTHNAGECFQMRPGIFSAIAQNYSHDFWKVLQCLTLADLSFLKYASETQVGAVLAISSNWKVFSRPFGLSSVAAVKKILHNIRRFLSQFMTLTAKIWKIEASYSIEIIEGFKIK